MKDSVYTDRLEAKLFPPIMLCKICNKQKKKGEKHVCK